MSEQLKEAILAKCQECRTARGQWMPVGSDSSGLALEYFADYPSGYFQIGSPSHVLCLKFNEETHSESIVWPLAAKILGISTEQPDTMEAQLWRAWKAAMNEPEWSMRVRIRERARFDEWMKSGASTND